MKKIVINTIAEEESDNDDDDIYTNYDDSMIYQKADLQ